jgi:hypothetical protein
MVKRAKQVEATSCIRELLLQRSLDISSRNITLEENQRWIIFEYTSRQIGIDSDSGVWIRESEGHDWRCISMPCTLSGALQAIDFLTEPSK